MAARVASPVSGVRVDLERLVSDAMLAPPGGNCQPWKWYWDGRLHLFLDRARAHSLRDYNYFGGYLTQGAAGELLGEGDRLRFLDQELQRQMMSELRFTTAEAARGDGGGLRDNYETLFSIADALADSLVSAVKNRNGRPSGSFAIR